jgi:hypothetical protein
MSCTAIAIPCISQLCISCDFTIYISFSWLGLFLRKTNKPGYQQLILLYFFQIPTYFTYLFHCILPVPIQMPTPMFHKPAAYPLPSYLIALAHLFLVVYLFAPRLLLVFSEGFTFPRGQEVLGNLYSNKRGGTQLNKRVN